MRSISKAYKQLNENQMMMGMQGGMQTPPQKKKTYHHPMQRKTAGPWQDQGPGLVEPPKQQQMPFPGPGMPGEVPGPSGLPVSGPEQSMPMMGMGQPQMGQMSQMGMGQQRPQMPQMGQMGMGQPQMGQMGMGQQRPQMPQMGQMGMGQPQMGQMGQMGMGQQQMGQMGMGQPQQPQIQIAQMGTFKQPFGEVPGQLGQMPQMGQMGMGQPQQMGAPGQNIQQALSKTRPITKIESLENRDVPDEFRYAPRAQQQPQQMGGMPQGMGQAPMGQEEGEEAPAQKKQGNKKLSPKEIKAMFDKIKRRGLGKK